MVQASSLLDPFTVVRGLSLRKSFCVLEQSLHFANVSWCGPFFRGVHLAVAILGNEGPDISKFSLSNFWHFTPGAQKKSRWGFKCYLCSPLFGKIPILTHICQRVVQPPTSRSLRLMLPVTRLSRKGVLFLAREDVFLAWVCQSASWLLQLNPLEFVQLATFLGYIFVVIKICMYYMLQIQCTPKNLWYDVRTII